ncbi:MAG TPA: MBL fold metallo-hydrolase, partial [Zoogloea sp.]|nr:MBL fold metallo-hydrolase [Zoogloea sp.]
MIGGCGRTDFQGGNAGTLYDSITERLFVMADETLVYPGHDYRGARVSCVGQEKASNPRLAGRSRGDFIELMTALDLPRPRMIDEALPANLRCGRAGELDIHAT